jgi:fibronectin-binding autotransporter adhesin
MRLRSLFCSAVFLSLGAAGSFAQVIWDGGGGGNQNWSDSLNWFPTNVPVNNGTATITFSNAVPYTSVVDSTYSIASLTIQNTAASVTLNSSGGSTLTVGAFNDSGFFGVNVGIAIVGNSAVSQMGLGPLTFNVTGSTYTGDTDVTSGSLNDAVVNAYSPNSLLQVGNSGVINVNHDETAYGLNDTGGGNGSVVIPTLGTVLILNGNTTTSFSGVISGAGGLEKNGNSTLVLTGANTYTGATLIDSGSAITIGNGGSMGSLVSNVSSTGTGSLGFDRTNPYTYAGTLSGTLNVVSSGSNVATLSGINTYSGTTTVFSGTFRAGSNSAFGGATGLSAVSINAGGTFDLNGHNNTVGSLGGVGTATLGGATLTLGNAGASSFFGGTISGPGSISSAEFSLTLSGNNTYSGGTTITSGTVIANNASGSGATGSGGITIDLGASLLLGQSNLLGNLNPTASITDLGTLAFDRSDLTPTVFSNPITGTGGVDHDGTGITTLTGLNTYSGTTTILQGTLQAGSTTAFSSASAVNFTSNGTLDLNGFNSTVASINATGPSLIKLGNGTLTIGNPASSTTYAGVISGPGSMAYGGNSIILTGTNTYTGGTTITHGSVLVAGAGSGTGTGNIAISPGAILDIGAGSTTGSVAAPTITDNGQVNFNRSDIPTFSGNINGTGTVTTNGGGVTLIGDNTYTGGTNITTGTVSVGDGTTIGSRITGNVFDGSALVFAPASSDNYTFSGGISGPGTVSFVGPGTITLSGANTYSGVTSVTGGNLADGAMNSFSAGSQMRVGSAGGSLSVNFNETVADLENGGSGGPVTIAASAVLTSLGTAYGGDFSGHISGAGGFTVAAGIQGLNGNNSYAGGTTVSGTGELFVGSDTALGTGTLTFAGTAPEMSPDANVTLANPIVLNAVFDNDDGLSNNMTLTGPITGPSGITWCAPGTLTLTNPGNTFGGTLDMRLGTLVVGITGATGGGTIILDSATTMNVTTGAVVSNPLSFTGTAAVLAGSGRIASPVVVDSGVVVAPFSSPGGGPGNLTFSGGLTLASGGAINLSLFDATGAAGTGYSLITASGGLTVAAGADSVTLNLFSTDSSGNAANAIHFNPSGSYSWTFATSSGLTGFVGNEFNIVTAGFSNGLAGGSFSVSGSSTDLVLNFTPVPEPSTWAMMASGLLIVLPFALRRRRTARA